MIRNDFVSNSSSSSFIVSADDNKYDILLQDYDILDLKEYCNHFIMRDVFEYCSFVDDIDKIKFVSDAEFNKRFDHNIVNLLPLDSKPIVELYFEHRKKRDKLYADGTSYNDPQFKEYYEALNGITDKIKEACVKSLSLKWKDVKFHYAEVDDNLLDEEKYMECDTMEDLIGSRIDYFKTLKHIKFYRTFSNH